ncbi:polysaccharide biosynthesis protein [Akkermansiaceae bacterium]|nr:polysaccharide biosynthesis protein [Akkermansiaceae bacterium]
MKNFSRDFRDLNRKSKVLLLLCADTVLVICSFFMAMVIRLEEVSFFHDSRIWGAIMTTLVVTLVTFKALGIYSVVSRYITGKFLLVAGKGALLASLSLYLIGLLFEANLPRSIPIIFWVLVFLSIGGYRFFLRSVFRTGNRQNLRRAIIYGAGECGLELLNSLFHGRDLTAVAFVDDNPDLNGFSVGGIKVFLASNIGDLIRKKNVKVILLAMPTLSEGRRREIVNHLSPFGLEIKTVPKISKIVNGLAETSQLRVVSAEELLGREPVDPDLELLDKNIFGKAVMVSGAGGSIGSELCRQILQQKPAVILLFDNSEFNLYKIEEELSNDVVRLKLQTSIVPILGSVIDRSRVEGVIKTFEIETIFHAAAYKHVPLVEENVVEGIKNNVFGSLVVASAAKDLGVHNFTMISTDKAVRPTNVMGATKRIAELICQAYAAERSGTIFSMVRFGNVLGSSGSVIPRFRSQIKSGGPLTVTHKDINRFFMTIPEAAQLVIQAGAMGKGGDVFVLDMGQPVKILDLAETMVKLCGLKPVIVDDLDQLPLQSNQIAIHITGLRRGEKLYEELLIGRDPSPTTHPRIMTASEDYLPTKEITAWLDSLLVACDKADLPRIMVLLRKMPLDYEPTGEGIFDLTWSSNDRKKTQE